MNRTIALTVLSVMMVGAACSIQARRADGGVFRSDDAGLTWIQKVFVRSERKRTVLLDGANAKGFRFDSTGALFLLTRESGVWNSVDRGEHWTQLGLTGSPTDFVIDPGSPAIQYAALGGNIQRSGDAGATWVSIYTAPRPGEAITGIGVDPKEPTHLVAITSAGSTIESRDSGASWKVLSFQTNPLSQLVMHPQTAAILYAIAPSGPIKSSDGGVTWTPLTPNLTGFPGFNPVSRIQLLPENPSVVYVATNAGLLVSPNGGDSWAPVPTLVPAGTAISSLAVRDSRTILFVTNNRLERTLDGGRTWSTPPVPSTRLLSALAFDPVVHDSVYVGVLKPTRK